jgi:hypothetical protein
MTVAPAQLGPKHGSISRVLEGCSCALCEELRRWYRERPKGTGRTEASLSVRHRRKRR